MTAGAKRVTRISGLKRVEFVRAKYGRDLLIDARFLSHIPAYDRSDRPHRLTFYDITLVTHGRGTIAVDDEVYEASPGWVFFSRPGDIRRLRVPGLDGACLFFTPEFIDEAFTDGRFLGQFAYFDADRPSAALKLTAAQRAVFVSRFRRMDEEFPNLRGDAAHFLRAVLYELLVLLGRWYAARHGARPPRTRNATVERFVALVERELSAELPVAACAAKLGVTPGHLRTLCRTHLGRSPHEAIGDRLMLEARRLLAYTDEPAASIGFRLGFRDPAYFGRRFRRATGMAPQQFRRARRT